MKKLTLALSTAMTGLTALTVAFAAPAMAAPLSSGPLPQDCSVHVLYQGSDVDVNWC